MLTKTVRSRFPMAVGAKVEGYTILEVTVVAPPILAEQRRGIYDYLVEVPPEVEKGRPPRSSPPPAKGSFTRSTPDAARSVIRRLPSK